MTKEKVPILTIEGIIQHLKERRNIEKELKEYEKYSKLISENANDLISIFNKEFEYEYVNEPIHEKVLGYKKEDLIGRSMLNIIHPQDQLDTINFFKNLNFRNGASMELRIKNFKGKYIWIESKGNLVIEEDGQNKILLISRDITERKEIERNLVESEEKFRNLFEKSPNAIILFNMEGEILDCNLNTIKLSGFKKAELIGKNFLEVSGIVEKYIPTVIKDFKTLIKGEIPEGKEIQLYTKERKPVWIFYKASIVNLGGEKVLQIIIQDISEKRESEQKLKESEEKYRVITENANDLISVVNHQFKYEYINQAYKRILGYTYEDLIGQRAVKFIHPDDIERVVKKVKETYKKEFRTQIFRMRHKDGSYRWLAIKSNDIFDGDGLTKTIVISRDITEQIKLENEL
ncbi:MAG: PAS domain S-box protein, partial [Promethearchaeota archaeon]